MSKTKSIHSIETRKEGKLNMLKNSGERKSGLIYSILTIIVLISISVGCEARGRIEDGQSARESGLLVTANLIKVGEGNHGREGGWREDLEEAARVSQQGFHNIVSIEIDGNNVSDWSDRGREGDWVELSPGHHVIEYVTQNLKNDVKKIDKRFIEGNICANYVVLDIKPHQVYVLIEKFPPESRRKEKGEYIIDHTKTHQVLVQTDLRYEHVTGFATHPTDSKLSFKVK